MPISQELIVSTLENTGYRPITLNSYREFISGVRYVAIETLGAEGLKVVQFLPTNHKSTWDVVRWDGADSTSLHICQSDRTKLDDTAYLRVGYDWFAKVAPRVNTTKDYFIGYRNRLSFFQTLEMFLENNNGGSMNRFDVAYSFERAHPANPTRRQEVDIERRLAEIAALEAEIRHRDNFAQVVELRSAGSQYLATGDQTMASAYFRESDALQRRIQATLDRGEQVVRETINVVAPTNQWFNAPTTTYTYGVLPTTAWAGSYDGGLFNPANPVAGSSTSPKPKLTTVETVKREPRVIEFDPEPED